MPEAAAACPAGEHRTRRAPAAPCPQLGATAGCNATVTMGAGKQGQPGKACSSRKTAVEVNQHNILCRQSASRLGHLRGCQLQLCPSLLESGWPYKGHPRVPSAKSPPGTLGSEVTPPCTLHKRSSLALHAPEGGRVSRLDYTRGANAWRSAPAPVICSMQVRNPSERPST